MKILRMRFDNIGLFHDGMQIDFMATDRVVNHDHVTPVHGSVNVNNVLGIVGINATGKTTVLRLINMAMDIVIQNRGLDTIEIPRGIVKDGTIMTVYFFLNNEYYKFVSEIGLESKEAESQNPEFYFRQEEIYKKLKSAVTSKKQVFEFTPAHEVTTRKKEAQNENSKFLKKYDSIITAVTYNQQIGHINMIFETNFNFFWTEGQANQDFVRLFDRSIASLSMEKNKASIKFVDSEEPYVEELIGVANILSSGTIKGLKILDNISRVIRTGGYLLVDEIENHMHKRLVQTIIKFFTNPEVNRHGATLVFSTHYIEIIDTIERKDNIIVLRKTKEGYAQCLKYSDEVVRNDIKKSEVLLSNLIDGTAVKYEDIKAVEKAICQ